MKTLIFYFTFVVLSACFFTLNAQKNQQQTCVPDSIYQTFTHDGSWCWFSDPRAVYFEGRFKRIYASWVNKSGDLVAGCYDIENQKITLHTIRERFQKDDHNNPAIEIDETGIISLYYTRHAQKTPLLIARTKKPEDIFEWEPERKLFLNDTITYSAFRNSYTYANICRLSDENNRLYLFWRGMDFKPNYSVSDDGGNSWTAGKIFILPDRLYRDRRPYIKVSSNNKDKIHFAFTDGHPRDEPTNSIYYAYYKNGSIYKANGEEIVKLSEVPFEPGLADMVYDAKLTNEKAWIWDVAEDTAGNPVLVYSRFPNDSNHHYYYARWNGLQWENHFLLNSGGWFPQTPDGAVEPEPHYSGGIVLDHENPSAVYLSAKTNGIFEIEKWSTIDGGSTWCIERITCNSVKDNIRPVAIRNARTHNPYQIIWMNVNKYVHYTNFDTSLKINQKKP